MRKSILTALAFATLSSAAFVGQYAPANATYYNQGNGYYYQKCGYVRVPYRWDYYGNPIAWRKVWRCW